MKANELIKWLSKLKPDTEIYASNMHNEWNRPITHMRIALNDTFAALIIDKD